VGAAAGAVVGLAAAGGAVVATGALVGAAGEQAASASASEPITLVANRGIKYLMQ
jgi:hypothetical protein